MWSWWAWSGVSKVVCQRERCDEPWRFASAWVFSQTPSPAPQISRPAPPPPPQRRGNDVVVTHGGGETGREAGGGGATVVCLRPPPQITAREAFSPRPGGRLPADSTHSHKLESMVALI